MKRFGELRVRGSRVHRNQCPESRHQQRFDGRSIGAQASRDLLAVQHRHQVIGDEEIALGKSLRQNQRFDVRAMPWAAAPLRGDVKSLNPWKIATLGRSKRWRTPVPACGVVCQSVTGVRALCERARFYALVYANRWGAQANRMGASLANAHVRQGVTS